MSKPLVSLLAGLFAATAFAAPAPSVPIAHPATTQALTPTAETQQTAAPHDEQLAAKKRTRKHKKAA